MKNGCDYKKKVDAEGVNRGPLSSSAHAVPQPLMPSALSPPPPPFSPVRAEHKCLLFQEPSPRSRRKPSPPPRPALGFARVSTRRCWAAALPPSYALLGTRDRDREGGPPQHGVPSRCSGNACRAELIWQNNSGEDSVPEARMNDSRVVLRILYLGVTSGGASSRPGKSVRS